MLESKRENRKGWGKEREGRCQEVERRINFPKVFHTHKEKKCQEVKRDFKVARVPFYIICSFRWEHKKNNNKWLVLFSCLHEDGEPNEE
jgi:hypothetical protein